MLKITLKFYHCKVSYFVISQSFQHCFSLEVTQLLERSAELIRTLEQLNISLREGKSVSISPRTLEAITGFKAQLESLLQGRKWRNTVERIWSFGPRRSCLYETHFID